MDVYELHDVRHDNHYLDSRYIVCVCTCVAIEVSSLSFSSPSPLLCTRALNQIAISMAQSATSGARLRRRMRPAPETIRLVGPSLTKTLESATREDPAVVLRRVRRAVHTIHGFGAFVGIMSIVCFIMGLFFRLPIEPRPGHWPTYGLVLLIPGIMRIGVGYLSEKAMRAQHHALILVLCAALLLLDLYNLIVLIAWIFKYIAQTLTTPAYTEFSVGAHIMYMVCHLIILCGGTVIMMNCVTAFTSLQFGLNHGKHDDEIEEDDEEEEDDDDEEDE